MDDDIKMAGPLDTPSRLAAPFSPIIERPPSPSKPLPPPPGNTTNDALQQLIEVLSHLGQQPPPPQPSSVVGGILFCCMACLHRGVLVCRILWIGWGYILLKIAYFYDQNDGTFISVPILEDKIRKLLVLCLHIFDFLNSSSYGAIYISLESHFHVEYNAS